MSDHPTLIMRNPFAAGTTEYYDHMIDCSAVKSTDGQVWTGKRHHHCMATIKQAGLKIAHADQGFVTMSGRFVTRAEAAALVKITGQCKLNHPPDLYSEDLFGGNEYGVDPNSGGGYWSFDSPNEPGVYWYEWCGNVLMCDVWLHEERLVTKLIGGQMEMYVGQRDGPWWYPKISKPTTPPPPRHDL